MSQSTIREPARETPVVHRTDVLVVGSGPGGLAAALAAAEAAAACCLATRTVVVRKPGTQNLVRYVVAVVGVGVLLLMQPSLLCRNWPRALMLDVPHHTAARWRLMLTTACVDRKA